VAAICPNCHREIHAGHGLEKNELLVQSAGAREANTPSGM
jgi:predicted HNH restriction endonuclease